MLRGILGDRDRLDQNSDEATYARIADLHKEESVLDLATRALILNKLPSPNEAALETAVANLQRAIAIDTARNEFLYHQILHQWFISGDKTADLEALNAAVYAELFLTPRSDPWLGLVTPDAYVAIDDEGIRH